MKWYKNLGLQLHCGSGHIFCLDPTESSNTTGIQVFTSEPDAIKAQTKTMQRNKLKLETTQDKMVYHLHYKNFLYLCADLSGFSIAGYKLEYFKILS